MEICNASVLVKAGIKKPINLFVMVVVESLPSLTAVARGLLGTMPNR